MKALDRIYRINRIFSLPQMNTDANAGIPKPLAMVAEDAKD